MKSAVLLLLIAVSLYSTAAAQSGAVAAKSIQQTQGSVASLTNQQGIKIPAGTKLDIEAAYTVSSFDVRPGDLLSFRVLVPVSVEGVTVIEKGALVTARVVEAKRGGHWGKAGRLSWTMQDVVAVDGQRLAVQTRDEILANRGGVKGTSHAGEIATKTVVLGVLLAPVFPVAPLALLQGFKRGENAILPEGKRFVVFLQNDTSVKTAQARTRE